MKAKAKSKSSKTQRKGRGRATTKSTRKSVAARGRTGRGKAKSARKSKKKATTRSRKATVKPNLRRSDEVEQTPNQQPMSELGTAIPREMPVQPLERTPSLPEDRDFEEENEDIEGGAPEREAS